MHLSITDLYVNYNFLRIYGNEIPSDWKDRIWDTLMGYRKNHLLTDSNKISYCKKTNIFIISV